MPVGIISGTTSACADFLHILYKEKKYSLEAFSKKFKDEEFSLSSILKECSVNYRGTTMTYDEMDQKHIEFSKDLSLFTRYRSEIRFYEPNILLGNTDYYKASKFLGKAAESLQTARYYLIHSEKLLSTDLDVSWSHGYTSQFYFRTLNFISAVGWYDNCFDYVLQIVYLAFELYKKVPKYDSELPFEDILAKCKYYTLKNLYKENQSVPNYSDLWKIITACHTALSNVKKWDTYMKNRGGIIFNGFTRPNPFDLCITDSDGNIVAESKEFYTIKLDLDQSIKLLQSAHKALLKCMDKLVTFINFKGAMATFDLKKGKMIIPNKSTYVKVILPANINRENKP